MIKERPDGDFSPSIADQISRGAEVIRAGGIVAFPTDTVYGLGADIYNSEAVKKVFTAKARPFDLPLPVLIADMADMQDLVEEQNAVAIKLMDKFWPGGLTIIFKCKTSLHSPLLAGSDKIGVRVPDHPLTRKLIQLAGRPMTGTSANLHNKPTARTAAEVKSQLGNSADFIIDGGACPGGIESTVIDVTVNPPAIIRQGIILREAISAAITTGRNQ